MCVRAVCFLPLINESMHVFSQWIASSISNMFFPIYIMIYNSTWDKVIFNINFVKSFDVVDSLWDCFVWVASSCFGYWDVIVLHCRDGHWFTELVCNVVYCLRASEACVTSSVIWIVSAYPLIVSSLCMMFMLGVKESLNTPRRAIAWHNLSCDVILQSAHHNVSVFGVVEVGTNCC